MVSVTLLRVPASGVWQGKFKQCTTRVEPGGGSRRLSGSKSRGPRPLEVEATEMPGDIDDFSDEVQSRNLARFHGFCRQFVGVDASRGDLCLVVTFGAGRCDRPAMQCVGKP